MAKEKKNLKEKNVKAKKEVKKDIKKDEPKKSLWVKFRIFCHGIKSEFLKVHWTSKSDLVKYSITTICFLVFTGLFFYLINVLFALVQSLV